MRARSPRARPLAHARGIGPSGPGLSRRIRAGASRSRAQLLVYSSAIIAAYTLAQVIISSMDAQR
jgi:hypothetical protein